MNIQTEHELEQALSEPSEALIEYMSQLDGDLMFLGVAGKMGISMARMAQRACKLAGIQKNIFGVSRFSSPEKRQLLDEHGIRTIQCDLIDVKSLQDLPEVANVIYLAGQKFGTQGNEATTWAMNAYMPGLIADRFRASRIVALSTGCVYPLVKAASKGSAETDPTEPIGEYAQSCLGRERLFEYGSQKYGTKTVLIRLFYSVELRYGVLVDIGNKVKNHLPIDLSMGYANTIWQTDANDMILRSLAHCESPAAILNIAGPEIFSVREVANTFARLMDRNAQFVGQENETALLGDARRAYELLGKPATNLNDMIEWTAKWLMNEGKLLDKPTHFEVRDGKY